jgi:tetratricopeptide (TPR) repeat protein
MVTVWLEAHHVGAVGESWNLGVAERALVAGRALWFYLAALAWPVGLTFVYPQWELDPTSVAQLLYPAAAVVAVVALFLARHRLGRGPLVAALYFAGTLAPALGFLDVYPFRFSFVADHFQYLAAIGPLVAAAAGITLAMGRLEPRWRRWLQPSLHGLLLSTLFLLCWSQSRMYADAERLYRTTVARNDACWMAHTHLGLLLMETGRHDEAMTHLQKAQALHPRQADAHSNLGLLFMDMGRTSEASEQLLKALALDPDHADAHNNLGALLAHDGRLDEAMRHLRQALALHPEHAEIHYNLGDLLARGGRTDEAVAHYQKALALHPGYADAHNNLGLLLAQLGNPTEAMARFRRALELDPGHANAHNNLGVLLAKAGQLDPAIEHHRQALSIDPTQTSHLDNLVSALLRRGRVSEAVSVVERSQATASAAGDEARAAAIARILARLRQAIGAAREAAHSGPPGDLPTR